MLPTGQEKVSIRQIGEEFATGEWRDYRSILTPEEFDEAFLLTLLEGETAFDAPEDSPLSWAPLHAWRALGQLRSVAAIEPVLSLAEGTTQQAYNDFASLCSQIGQDAIEPLVAILADPARTEICRTLAAEGLGAIGSSATGEARRRIVEALIDQIRRNRVDGWVNGMAAEALMSMGERSVGSDILRLYNEGYIQIGMDRATELTTFFSQDLQE